VEKALTKVKEIRSVKTTQVQAKPIIPDGCERPFFKTEFKGDVSNGAVVIRELPNGERTICLIRAWINRKPTAEEVRRTRELIDQVYAGLRAEFPEIPPPDQWSESVPTIQNK
jgi:hypothetical protein